MIRKEAKARWAYTCEPCSVHVTHPDQFRAIETQQRHEKGLGHFGNAFSSIVRDAFAPLLSAFGWAPLHPWQEAVLTRAMWEGVRK
ncbi:hypothetical protein SRABI26_02705 [Arthrobacter sp. Bi26]|uniref:hypothetical protein n=1 Tax=Arthrobacter sp. Bi26 TaxID=2822350 RepID=UPI001DBFE187|nr:hypothetical protein [Arthrobacter sp. Bi26]CAH0233368.1 hypothetical protein SRABI26_02705 [Arthrobacter sp. Bi26]